MKRNPDLVLALDPNGTEVWVSKSFAQSHGLELVDGDQSEPQTADTAAAEPVSTTSFNHPEGSDSSASNKED